MIKELESFEEINGDNSPLIPRIFSAYKYKTGSDNAWKQVAENGDIIALLSSIDGNFTLIANDKTDVEEIKDFLNFFGFNSLVSNVPLKQNSLKKYTLFKFCGEEVLNNSFNYFVLDSASTVSHYKKFYSLLFLNGEGDFSSWYCDFSRKIVNSDAKAVALNQTKDFLSIAVAPTIYKSSAIISGVFTLNDFRNKGYSKATIYKLINELKKYGVTEIYLWCEKHLEEFYSKLGFKNVGNVYMETEL